MLKIHKLSWLIVLLLISAAFSEDAKKGDEAAFIRFFHSPGSPAPSRSIMIEGSRDVLAVSQGSREYGGSKDDNLIYSILSISQRSPVLPKTIDRSMRSDEDKFWSIRLIRIPSTTDSEEIRQKYLDLACKDFEEKLQIYQKDWEKTAQFNLKKDQDDLSKLDKDIQQLKQRKAEIEATERKQQFNSEILGYLYKEKIKLELDQLEQRAKLDAMSKYLDQIAKTREEISKTYQEALKDNEKITKEIDALSKTDNPSQVRLNELKNQKADIENKIRSLMGALLPENRKEAMPKEQFADIKITQAGTEKRYQEVSKLISQYEQAEKNATDLTEINKQLEDLGGKSKSKLRSIQSWESSLKDIQAHPVRVINKADYDAMQSKKAEKEGDVKESEEAVK